MLRQWRPADADLWSRYDDSEVNDEDESEEEEEEEDEEDAPEGNFHPDSTIINPY